MKSVLPFLLSAVVAGPIAMNFHVRRGNSPDDAIAQPALMKRDSASVSLSNQRTFYMVNITVGTPGQNVGVLIDTGSSDLWIMGSENPFCGTGSSHDVAVESRLANVPVAKPHKAFGIDFKKLAGMKRDESSSTISSASSAAVSSAAEKNLWSDIASFATEIGGGGSPFGATTIFYTSGGGGGGSPGPSATQSAEPIAPSGSSLPCDIYGTFDESKSSTFHSNNTGFEITYGDTTFAAGTWSYDTVELGNTTVTDFSFALANSSNSTMGVLGVGLAQLETTYANSASVSSAYTYENLPLKLVSEGHISRAAYSLYLNELSASSGTILFGAVDHNKYSGSLQTVAVINTLASMGYNKPVRLQVTLSSISVARSSGSSSISTDEYPALLDSGTTLIYMPSNLIDSIANNLGAKYSKSIGYYTIDCGMSNVNVTFNFTGAQIQVPVQNLIVNSAGSSVEQGSSDKGSCMLGLLPSGENALILGDPFIAAAYLVYDLDNYQVSMAQAVYGSSSSNIEEISASGTIPGASSAAQYSATFSGTLAADTGAIGAAASSTSSSSSGSSSSSPPKKDAASSVAIPMSFVLASFIAGLTGFI